MFQFLVTFFHRNDICSFAVLFLTSIFLNCNSTTPLSPDTNVYYNLTIIAGNGGKIISPAQQVLSLKENTTISIAAIAAPGFSFSRWKTIGDNANVTYTNASFTKVTTGQGNDTVIAEFISISPLPVPIDISTIQTESGVNFLLYMGSWTNLPDFDTLKPDTAGSADSLSIIKLPEYSTGFGIVMNSYLSIPLDGNYYFYLGSLGKSALYLNDSLVLANEELQPTQSLDSVKVQLLQGTYLIEVQYFAATSSPYFNVSYSCPDIGIEKSTIPTDALMRCDTRPAVKIIINKPAGGETFHPGDTIHIQWTYKNPRGQIFAQLSVNNGKTFLNICNEAFPGTVSTYNWVLPVDSDSLISSNALIRVKEYPPYSVYGVSKKFIISGY